MGASLSSSRYTQRAPRKGQSKRPSKRQLLVPWPTVAILCVCCAPCRLSRLTSHADEQRGSCPACELQDGVQLPFENYFDYSSFSVRVPEEEIPSLVSLLTVVPWRSQPHPRALPPGLFLDAYENRPCLLFLGDALVCHITRLHSARTTGGPLASSWLPPFAPLVNVHLFLCLWPCLLGGSFRAWRLARWHPCTTAWHPRGSAGCTTR